MSLSNHLSHSCGSYKILSVASKDYSGYSNDLDDIWILFTLPSYVIFRCGRDYLSLIFLILGIKGRFFYVWNNMIRKKMATCCSQRPKTGYKKYSQSSARPTLPTPSLPHHSPFLYFPVSLSSSSPLSLHFPLSSFYSLWLVLRPALHPVPFPSIGPPSVRSSRLP